MGGFTKRETQLLDLLNKLSKYKQIKQELIILDGSLASASISEIINNTPELLSYVGNGQELLNEVLKNIEKTMSKIHTLCTEEEYSRFQKSLD